MERLPSARGPASTRPWNQPTMWPAAIRSAVWRAMSAGRVAQPAAPQRRLDLVLLELRTEIDVIAARPR
jgi:hypothetical protein